MPPGDGLRLKIELRVNVERRGRVRGRVEGRGGRRLKRETQLDHNKTFIKVICFALGHLHSYELERN